MHIVRTLHALLAHMSLYRPPSPPNSNASSSPQSPPNPNNPSIILNDTSLAATMISDNERHLFFQDTKGVIRQVVRSKSSSSWVTSPYLNVTSHAKYQSPLTATAIKGKVSFRSCISERLPCVLTLKSLYSSTSRTTTTLVIPVTALSVGVLPSILEPVTLQHPNPDIYHCSTG